VPSGALFYLGFKDLGPTLQRLLDVVAAGEPEVGRQLGQLEAATGVSFTGDLVPLLSGEHAVYATVGSPVAGALLLKPADAAKGAATLKKLTNAGGAPGWRGLHAAGRRRGRAADPGRSDVPLAAGRRRAGDRQRPEGREDQGGGLAGTDRYKALLEKAGAPDEVNGVLYVDVPGLVTLGAAADDAADADDRKAIENLEHLGGLLAWAALDGDTYSSDVFVEVR
jgi:hypothetical protein